MGAEFVRGRVCQGQSLLGAEMSRNRFIHSYARIQRGDAISMAFCWRADDDPV